MAEKKGKAGRTVIFKKLTSPIVTVILFVAAAAMLLGSTIGGTRAALQFYSANYLSSVSLKYIGVSLMESNVYTDPSQAEDSSNYKRVAWRDYKADGVWDRTNEALVEEGVGTLLTGLLGTGENQDKAFKVGKEYTEKLAVANTGTIDTYVRVVITKYWTRPQKGADGNVTMVKDTQLDPGMIDLHWINNEGPDAVWLIDEEVSTPERTVLYYKHILEAMKETEGGQRQVSMTEPLCDTLTVKGEISNRVTQKTESREENGRTYTTITTTYDYDGTEFVVKAEVDAVQTHSAEDAIWSAWGRRVSIDVDENGNGTKDLSLTVDRTAGPATDTTEPDENGTGTTEPGESGTDTTEPGEGGTDTTEPDETGTGTTEPGESGTDTTEPGEGGTSTPEPDEPETDTTEPDTSGTGATEPAGE